MSSYWDHKKSIHLVEGEKYGLPDETYFLFGVDSPERLLDENGDYNPERAPRLAKPVFLKRSYVRNGVEEGEIDEVNERVPGEFDIEDIEDALEEA